MSSVQTTRLKWKDKDKQDKQDKLDRDNSQVSSCPPPARRPNANIGIARRGNADMKICTTVLASITG